MECSREYQQEKLDRLVIVNGFTCFFCLSSAYWFFVSWEFLVFVMCICMKNSFRFVCFFQRLLKQKPIDKVYYVLVLLIDYSLMMIDTAD